MSPDGPDSDLGYHLYRSIGVNLVSQELDCHLPLRIQVLVKPLRDWVALLSRHDIV